MSHLKRLSLAGGLAIVAAILNSLYLAAQTRPSLYVAISADIQSGQIVTDSFVRAIPIPGDANRLKQSMIPYGERNVVVGLPASRDYLKGDVVFYRDLKPPEKRTRWEVLGPFRLISVNERNGDSTTSFETRGNSITIAVSPEFEGDTQRLLEVIGEQANDRRQIQSEHRIAAVQIVPPDSGSDSTERLADEVFQTVKFDSDVQLPPILVNGDLIRFVLKDTSQL